MKKKKPINKLHTQRFPYKEQLKWDLRNKYAKVGDETNTFFHKRNKYLKKKSFFPFC